jgi:serine/threonine-protein kinase
MAKAPLPDDAEPDATATKAPESIGKYKIVRKIGSGGMGAVYLATDTQMRRNVALKLLPKEKAQNPTLVRRFYAEVQAAAALKHENIVMVYDAGEAAGYHYMALEFVDGQDAADLIAKRDRIPVKRTIEIVRQTALALEHAHAANIVHRDIKPANLLIRRDGVVKLADLGLARSLDEAADTGITRAGTTVGTVDYMSPEQARDSKSADARSDIYSLGCTWYHLLTGSPPFNEGGMTNKLRAHAVAALPNPQSVNDAIPDELVAVLHRMMAKKAVDRYQNIRELIDDLDELANTGESRTKAILDDGDSAVVVPKPKTNRGEMVEIPDDSAADIPKTTKAARTTGVGTASNPSAKPGRRRRPPRIDGLQDEEEPARDYSMLVYGGLVAAAIGVVGGLGYLVAGFGGAFDAPSKSEVDTLIAADGRHDGAAPIVTPPLDGKSTVADEEPKEATAAKTNAAPPRKLPDLAKESHRHEFETRLLPDWVSLELVDAAVPRKFVASQADGVVNLNDAISELSATGGHLLLSGNGPFELRASTISPVRPLRIAVEDPAVTPVVLLTAGSTDPLPNAAFVTATGAALEFSGLDIRVAASVQPGQFGGRVAYFASLGDGIRLRQCRITGPSAAAVVVALRTGPDGTAVHQNVLFDECSIRGGSLSLLETLHADVDLVVRNSVAATDAEPMLRFILPSEVAVLHHLRAIIVGSTLACGQGALQWQGASDRLMAVDLLLVNSLIATPDDVGSRFAEFFRLSSTASKAAFGQRIRLRSVGSYLAGWNSLSFATPENVPVFPQISEFLAAWNQDSPLREANIVGSPWPIGVDRLSTAPGAALDASTTDRFKTLDGSTAGAGRDIVSRLPDPLATGGSPRSTSASVGAKADAIPYNRSTLIPPEFFGAAADGPVIRVDLNREDLGKVLTEQPPSTGSLIVASGSGQRTCTPFSLRDVWVRIRFEPTEEGGLVLTPRGLGPALISVHNGGLALEEANILFVTSERNRQPQWVISAVDSDVLLNRCRLWGPTLVGGVNKGLIHVAGVKREKPTSRPFPGDALAYVGIANSFLGGGGNAIDIEARGRELFVDNAILAGRDHSVRWNIPGSDAAVGGASRFRKTTFSAPAPLHLDAFDLTRAGSPGHTVEMEACIFTPSLKDDPYPGGPSVMTFEGAANQSKPLGLSWSEERCGYSSDWTSFIRPVSQKQPVGQTFDSVWRATWGAAAIVDPLVGRNGVVLVAGPIRQRPRFEVMDYALTEDCSARTHDLGSPIGADLSRIPSEPVSTPGPRDKSDKADAKPDASKSPGKKANQPMGF